MGKGFFFIFLFLSSTFKGVAQQADFTWWNNKANWDGITSWHQYLEISPRFLGPNALPVPQVKTGTMPKPAARIAADVHTSAGDNAQNLFTALHIPLFSNKVGLNMQIAPIERYVMDTVVRDLRLARDKDGQGFAIGDLYIGTYIQLVKDKAYWPDLLLTLNLRTASGSHFYATRFTDTPGYFFDLSGGKKIVLQKGGILKAIQPHAMLGFYVYQTNRTDYLQNDCFLYGAGVNFHFNKLLWTNALGGYAGYINNGDKPMVYRLGLRTNFKSRVNYEFRFQKGFFDFLFTSYRFGIYVSLKELFPSTRTKEIAPL